MSEFKASLVYRASSRRARGTQRNPVSNPPTPPTKKKKRKSILLLKLLLPFHNTLKYQHISYYSLKDSEMVRMH